MSTTRPALLIVGYVLLVGIVAFGAFWIKDQFNQAAHRECHLSAVQLRLDIANVLLITDTSERAAFTPIVNQAVQGLNDACGTDIKEIQ